MIIIAVKILKVVIIVTCGFGDIGPEVKSEANEMGGRGFKISHGDEVETVNKRRCSYAGLSKPGVFLSDHGP